MRPIVFEGTGHRGSEWLKCPEFPSCLKVNFISDDGYSIPWIGCSHSDPLFEDFDVGISEFFLGRHLHVIILPMNGFDQQAVGQVFGNNCRTEISPFANAHAGIQEQSSLHLVGPLGMALITMSNENGPDFFFKKNDSLFIAETGTKKPT